MSMDAYMMIARVEQEYRMEQAAKINHLNEVERIRRGNRPGLFTRRIRSTK